MIESPLNDYIWLAERGRIYTSYFQVTRKQSVSCNESISCNVVDVCLVKEHPIGKIFIKKQFFLTFNTFNKLP